MAMKKGRRRLWDRRLVFAAVSVPLTWGALWLVPHAGWSALVVVPVWLLLEAVVWWFAGPGSLLGRVYAIRYSHEFRKDVPDRAATDLDGRPEDPYDDLDEDPYDDLDEDPDGDVDVCMYDRVSGIVGRVLRAREYDGYPVDSEELIGEVVRAYGMTDDPDGLRDTVVECIVERCRVEDVFPDGETCILPGGGEFVPPADESGAAGFYGSDSGDGAGL